MDVSLTNFDFYDDKGALLRQLIPNPTDIPAFVKTAHVMQGTEDADLYALVLKDRSGYHKKFSTYDRGNTWMSSSYFAENHENLVKEAQVVAASNLKRACEAFGVPVLDVIEKLASEVSGNIVDVEGIEHTIFTKQAAAQDFALGNKYPLGNARDVMDASRYFEDYVKHFSPEERREYAVKVASAAEKFGGLPVSDSIQLYSGDTTSPGIEDHLKYRIEILKNQDAFSYDKGEQAKNRDAVYTLSKLASVASSLDPDVIGPPLVKFDRKHGLDRYWDTDILDPYASALEKKASGFEPGSEVIKVGPNSVSKTDLMNLAKNTGILTSHFGEDFTASYIKDPVGIFQSMPTPQKTIIMNMAHSQDK